MKHWGERKMKENSEEFYIAIPHAILDYEETAYYQGVYTSILSDPIGFFVVKPVRRLKIIRSQFEGFCLRSSIVGFKDYTTGKTIINTSFKTNKEGDTEVLYHDILSSTHPAIGDVQWELFIPHFSEGEKTKIERYKRFTKNEILDKICQVHEEAQELAIERQRRGSEKNQK